MAKIHYEDDDLEHHANSAPNSHERQRRFTLFMASVIVLCLIVGAIGGVGGVLLFSADNGYLAQKLGLPNLKNISIPTSRTEKLVVEESNAVIDTAKKIGPSVVSITQKGQAQNIFGQIYQTEGAGTGFIITNDGLILTNRHVAGSQNTVYDVNTTYTVLTADGKSYDAQVKSVDPTQDIAVLKIDAKNLPVAELGDSDQLQVGQYVVAVGNALGEYQNSVTLGVVSGRNRKIQASDSSGGSSETLDNLIQTDAAINPGNSGGPLVNLKGQVVGINTAVASNAQGIGFAIPINAAKSDIESIQKTGRIIRPYLGIRYVQITPEIAKSENLPVDYGALVIRGQGLTDLAVVPGSPADKVGIKENDIIEEINGEKINENSSFLSLLQQYQVGDEIELKVLSGGKEKTVKVKLEERK